MMRQCQASRQSNPARSALKEQYCLCVRLQFDMPYSAPQDTARQGLTILEPGVNEMQVHIPCAIFPAKAKLETVRACAAMRRQYIHTHPRSGEDSGPRTPLHRQSQAGAARLQWSEGELLVANRAFSSAGLGKMAGRGGLRGAARRQPFP
jgi:hypothetical protein